MSVWNGCFDKDMCHEDKYYPAKPVMPQVIMDLDQSQAFSGHYYFSTTPLINFASTGSTLNGMLQFALFNPLNSMTNIFVNTSRVVNFDDTNSIQLHYTLGGTLSGAVTDTFDVVSSNTAIFPPIPNKGIVEIVSPVSSFPTGTEVFHAVVAPLDNNLIDLEGKIVLAPGQMLIVTAVAPVGLTATMSFAWWEQRIPFVR